MTKWSSVIRHWGRLVDLLCLASLPLLIFLAPGLIPLSMLASAAMAVNDVVGTLLTRAEAIGREEIAGEVDRISTVAKIVIYSGASVKLLAHGWLGIIGLLPVLLVDKYATGISTKLARKMKPYVAPEVKMHLVLTPAQAQVGDMVLFHTSGIIGKLIRMGELLRWRGFSTWNHCAIISSIDNGVIKVIQMARHCDEVELDLAVPHAIVSAPDGTNRAAAVAYAQSCLGIDYSYFEIATIAFNILTPKWFRGFDFRKTGTLICSALVARAWEHGGVIVPFDPFQVSPSELAIFRDVPDSAL